MASKLISIIGSTATGKSSLALKLAEKLVGSGKFMGVDIISVDSRQVYKGLEIVSGADLPSGFAAKIIDPGSEPGMTLGDARTTVWEKDKIRIHGIGIINPDEQWSVAHFRVMALDIIAKAKKTNRLVILVGGTGLYLDQLIKTNGERIKANTLGIAPNLELRKELESCSVAELQVKLQKLDRQKFASMNESDNKNPRRLIRAIEVASKKSQISNDKFQTNPNFQISNVQNLIIGLIDNLENIEQKIKARVIDRFENGAVEEVKTLLRTSLPAGRQGFVEQSLPALSATGVKEIAEYLHHQLTRQKLKHLGGQGKEECLDAWTLREYQYAKRQITWWKKNQQVKWLTVSKKNWQTQALQTTLDFVL